ncbi:MAG: protein translocase subunit SecD, partial [Peptococcaceae bacterium]|nr:protein translocase subunit SecD [Peptococcaceae bacterium]
MRRGNIVKLVVLLLVVAALVAVSIKPLTNPDKGVLLGLDLRGGVHLALQAVPEDGSTLESISRDDIDTAKAIIETRVNALGVSEPVLQADYDKKRVIVDLAGVQDPDAAVELIRSTAKLTFRDPSGNVVLEGSELSDARADKAESGGGYVVNLTFNSEGARKFEDLTTQYVGQRIGVYLDETILTNPTVKKPITGGSAYIDGYQSMEDAANDAVLMRSGALPVKMTIAEKRQVGASLGVDSLHKSIVAGILGITFIYL